MRIREAKPDEWADYHESCRGSTFGQSPAARLLWGFPCRHEAWIADGGAAGVQVRVLGWAAAKTGIAHVSEGPIASSGRGRREWLTLVHFLIDEYSTRRGFALTLKPPLEADLAGWTEDLQELALRRTGRRRYCTILLDLSSGAEAIRRGFKKRLKYALNRGAKNRFAIVAGSAPELYERFLVLYGRLQRRKNFRSGLPVHRFRKIFVRKEASRGLVVSLASLAGEDMAAAVHAYHGGRAVYLLGASKVEDGMPPERKFASHLLQWEAVKRAIRAGCRWFDLGGIDPRGNPGVTLFKRSFGGIEFEGSGLWLGRGSLPSQGLLRVVAGS